MKYSKINILLLIKYVFSILLNSKRDYLKAKMIFYIVRSINSKNEIKITYEIFF